MVLLKPIVKENPRRGCSYLSGKNVKEFNHFIILCSINHKVIFVPIKMKRKKCVVDLIDYPDCFCLGRLDRDTTGLLILTNDKSLKKLLLPQNHVEKTYLVETKERLNKEDQEAFKRGIIIDQKIQCLPAKLEIVDDYHGYVTIEERKYHQIKKMFLSLKNEVVSLKRISFDEIF